MYRAPRHDREGRQRGGDRRRAGPRDQPRGASPRHRAGDQGAASIRWDRSAARSSAPSSAGGPGKPFQGGQFGFGAAFLRYSREYEKQADLLGAQIMARSGYDPRAMATMFRRSRRKAAVARPGVAEQPPESRQPRPTTSPRKRRRCASRTRSTTRGTSRTCRRGCGRCRRRRPRRKSPAARGNRIPRGRPEPAAEPAGCVARRRHATDLQRRGPLPDLRASNWREMPSENQVTFAPEGAYGDDQQRRTSSPTASRSAWRATKRTTCRGDRRAPGIARAVEPRHEPALGLQRAEPRRPLRRCAPSSSTTRTTPAANGSRSTRRRCTDGTLFYMIGVAPENEYGVYDSVFQRIAQLDPLHDSGTD